MNDRKLEEEQAQKGAQNAAKNLKSAIEKAICEEKAILEKLEADKKAEKSKKARL